MSVSAARVLARMFGDISVAIDAQKDHLSDLDGAIGDGDHGITMSLGFSAVAGELAGLDLGRASAASVLASAATVFLNAVGASTGPLYASGFLRAAKVFEGNDTLAVENQAAMIEAIAAGVQARGKGQRGDKTMLDVWIPAAEAATASSAHGADAARMWNDIMTAAETGANATRSMVAARGRAARLGERSLGHMDPGAASAVTILRVMHTALVDGPGDI